MRTLSLPTRPLSLKLQITHCTGLAKADRFGLSDPFCVIKWPANDRELGRTPTVYNTIHPVWKECFFEIPVPAPTPTAPAIDEGTGDSIDDSGVGDVMGGDGDGNKDEHEEKDRLLLTLQVWDEDEGAAADFLGEREFDAQALLEMARARLKLVSFRLF